MILPFSTKINGKETYFPERILTGLIEKKLVSELDFNSLCPAYVIIDKGDKKYKINFEKTINHKPKYHSFREDINQRWNPQKNIDFFINTRQPNMYRFAPVLPVVSTQKVQIFYKGLFCAVAIDNNLFYSSSDNSLGKGLNGMLKLANNDGFDTIEDFFNYFNKDYTGKIIHWTDLKY